MGGKREQDVLGMDAPFAGRPVLDDETGHPVGMGQGPDEVIEEVVKKWDVNKLITTPRPVIKGTTETEIQLVVEEGYSGTWTATWWEQRGKAMQLPWGGGIGLGGGKLDASYSWDAGKKKMVAVVTASFLRVVPVWADEEKAPDELRARWNQMMPYLLAHEQRHVQIAVEAAKNLAYNLDGEFTSKFNQTVNEICQDLRDNQIALDTDTDNGREPDVDYGNVIF